MNKFKKILCSILVYGILTAGAAFVLLPFLWMLLTSLKPSNEVLLMPPKWLPSKLMWENYAEAFHAAPFARYFINSLAVSLAITVGELITTILAAFAFSQIEFKGRDFLFMLLVATMMVPGEILIIPNYVTLAELGWINSYKALIFPWCASVFSIFLLRQQFTTIPKAYYKAAKVDGCSRFRYLFIVLVPMSKPTIAAIALLKLINSWNSYMWPLIVTNTDEMRTLPVALASFSTEAGVKYNTLMAFSLMMITPIIIVYFFTQKYIIRGISNAGLKG